MIDFSECEFIRTELRFYTFKDFCDNKREIKKLFLELSYNGQLFYKWYVYANTHMGLARKNAIWDYLQGYDNLGLKLIKLSKDRY